jgi:hypothetical protein
MCQVHCYHINYYNYFVFLKPLYFNQKLKVEVIFTKFTNSYNKSEKVFTHLDYFQLKCSTLGRKPKPLTSGRKNRERGMRITATKTEDYAISGVDHFGLEVSINHSCVEEIEQKLLF